MRWRRWLLPAAAVLCVPVAIALVLFAVDVLRVGGAVEGDDVRFQARPALPTGLFEDPGFLPGAVAPKAVGLEDDLRYRRAVWLYARANPSNTTVYLTPAARGACARASSRSSSTPAGRRPIRAGARGCSISWASWR